MAVVNSDNRDCEASGSLDKGEEVRHETEYPAVENSRVSNHHEGDGKQHDDDGGEELGRLGLAELEVHRRHDGGDDGADQHAEGGGESHAGNPFSTDCEGIGEATRQLHGGSDSHDCERCREPDRRADEVVDSFLPWSDRVPES